MNIKLVEESLPKPTDVIYIEARLLSLGGGEAGAGISTTRPHTQRRVNALLAARHL